MRHLVIAYLIFAAAQLVSAATLKVQINAEDPQAGIFYCSLYQQEEGFPKEREKAMLLTQGTIQADQMLCEFKDLKEGQYAFSAMQDLNGNGKMDQNFLGIPREPWGSSNNVRPSMRPPRFKEAVFSLKGDMMIQVEVKK